MAGWQRASATPLGALLAQGPPPLAPPPYPPALMPAEHIAQIRQFFKIYWICAAAGLGLCITCIGAILGIPALIAAFVFQAMLLYKLWRTLPAGWAASAPVDAVAFLFIPFFNFYWFFVAIWGLSKDLNRFAREHNIAAPRAGEGLALTWCILYCCAVVPYAGILAAIAGMIVAIFALKSMCETAIAIIQRPDEA
jgi:hypothetical protein